MKIVFMGTPDFARCALESIIEDGYEVTAVVTQPDKPKGRSGALQMSPVKECALKYNIPVFQPTKIRTPEAIEELKKYPADVYIVAAFGQILTQEILDIPRLGSINIHGSILPKLRGASPIQHSIINGDEETGITIMQMDAGIDTGDMLYVKKLKINSDDTYETLHDRLAILGGQAITEALPLIEKGKLTPVKQDDSQSTYAGKIEKTAGELDFTKDAVVLDRLIRGFTPWPGSYTYFNGKQLKVWKAVPVSEGDYKNAGCGEIVSTDKDSFLIKCNTGALKVLEIQLEGKKRMTVHDFLLGAKLAAGDKLGR